RSHSDFVLKAIAVHGVAAALAFVREPDEWLDPVTKTLQPVPESEQLGRAPLTLSESINSHKKAKRGSLGISGFGRKMVKSGATILERDFGRRNLTLATLTIGYTEKNQWTAITENWSEIVRRLLQELNRQLESSGLKGSVLYVTELQESRLERYGVPGYHLHLLWPNLRPGLWSVRISELRSIWRRILSSYVPSSPGSPLPNHRVEVAVVKKSAAAYLAKYLSKGLSPSVLLLFRQAGWEPPKSWWGMSSVVRRKIKKEIVTIADRTARFLMDGIECGIFRGSICEHKHEYMGGMVTLGFYGYLGGWNSEHVVNAMASAEKNARTSDIANGLVPA
ncbi:MAG: hypothetical protein WCA35_16900, partial [Kovacikia sp.]